MSICRLTDSCDEISVWIGSVENAQSWDHRRGLQLSAVRFAPTCRTARGSGARQMPSVLRPLRCDRTEMPTPTDSAAVE